VPDAAPLLLGHRSLARLLGIPRDRVLAAMDAGRLVSVATTGLRGRVCRYVVVDAEGPEGEEARAKLDRWAETQAAPLYLTDVEVPRTNGGKRWFYPPDVRAAASGPDAPFTVDRRERVTPCGGWLRWAASWMPKGERAAVLGSLVNESAST
jgi:hypothetical protein